MKRLPNSHKETKIIAVRRHIATALVHLIQQDEKNNFTAIIMLIAPQILD
jgi:hypothetical protein